MQQPPAQSASGFWPRLAIVLLLGLAAQSAILFEFISRHPAAQFPLADGEAYWDMARDMADGHWMGDTPFLSAPLYPYFLGVLRAIGVGLTGLYILQAGMLLLSAAVLACVARRRFGDTVGIVAAAIFLLLSDDAVSTTRALGNCAQLLLVVLLWQQWAALSESSDRRKLRIAACGLLLGALALTYPAAMLLAPLFAAWLWWDSRRTHPTAPRTGLAHAALGLACVAAAIAPATLHNWIVSHELIPITAHAGVTLRHGNQPQSKGTYTPIPGVAPGRIGLHESAAKIYEQTEGKPATWKSVDRFFRDQVVDFYLHQPGDAAKLIVTKAYLYFTFRHYDDICIVALDRELNLARASWLAPIAVPWIMGLSLVGLFSLRHEIRRFSPEILLVLLTLVVVVVFFYSPRYRLPATPILAALAAFALVRFRDLKLNRPIAIGLALLLPIASIANEVAHYDDPARARITYNHVIAATYLKLARNQLADNQPQAAENSLRAALALEPAFTPTHQLATLLARTSRFREAVVQFQAASKLAPGNLNVLRDLYHAAISCDDRLTAKAALEKILVIKPQATAPQKALESLMTQPAPLPSVDQW